MSAIKNVTLVGGSGHLGTPVLEKLLRSKKFNVQVLKRAGSSSTFAGNPKVVEADYDDIDAITAAFEGQHAIVSLVNDAGVANQKVMIDAAIAAGVKRFLPSNFGSNMANPNARRLPLFKGKVFIEDYLKEKAKTTDLTYSFVYVGGFTDYAIQRNVILNCSTYQPTIYNGGETEFSTTSLATIGDAVVGVLSHPGETQNRPVYVSEVIYSQKKLLSLAKQVAPDKPWAPVNVDLDVVFQGAMERLSQGFHDLPTLLPILLKSIVDPEYGSKFTENDNELLGVKVRGDDFLVDLIAPIVS